MMFNLQLLAFFLIISTIGWSQDTIQNFGNIQIHSGGQMAFHGSLVNNGTFNTNSGSAIFSGNSLQTISGTSPVQFENITINNSSNVKVDLELRLSGTLTFSSGKILTDRADISTEYVHFLSGSSYTGESNSSFIDGVVRKTGNESFVFPTGANSAIQKIHISAPSTATDHFTAYYEENDPNTSYSISSIDLTCLNHVSRCEYWILNRTGGSSSVEVTLDFDANSCGVTDLCDLLVARWDGTEWVNEGNGGTTGTVSDGTVTSGNGCGSCGTSTAVTSFSPFTIGSATSLNPLPITLLSFDATLIRSDVRLDWITASEQNTASFTVERSIDGIVWHPIASIAAAGNSSTEINYETWDLYPLNGLSYYRLKQLDLDGQFSYSELKSVYLENASFFSVFPNPTSNTVMIAGDSFENTELILFNLEGKYIPLQYYENENGFITFDVSSLAPGLYQLKILRNEKIEIKQIIIQ